MPKPRNSENKGLPARWTLHHNAYYYYVPAGLEYMWGGKKRFRLGKTLPEAFKTFASHLNSPSKIRNINQLLDRYLLEVVPTKAAASQVSNHQQIKRLRVVFGELPLLPFPPKYVYQYVDKSKSKISAKREIATLSHAYTKAVKWGEIDKHPFKGQVVFDGEYSEKPRTRYVEDWEIIECLKLKPKAAKGGVAMVQAYIKLKLLTGLGRGDLLRLNPAINFKDDGIHIQRHKTVNSSGKKTIYAWTPSLRSAVRKQ
jgi:integrase